VCPPLSLAPTLSQNLYFAYLFVLRAVTKAGAHLASYQYTTGLPEQDAFTARLINDLVRGSISAVVPHVTKAKRAWHKT
jgi:hypothetical protein